MVHMRQKTKPAALMSSDKKYYQQLHLFCILIFTDCLIGKTTVVVFVVVYHRKIINMKTQRHHDFGYLNTDIQYL